MKVALVADLHLDAAFALFPRDLARERRHGIEAAFREAMATAANAAVDAVLLAGDLYEHDRVAPNTGELLRSIFAEVAPLPVFIAPGNHDWYGPESLYERLDWPPNVHVFREDRLEPVELEDGLTLWGAAHRAPANTDGFLERFRADRPGVNVALFHGSEQSALFFQEDTKVPHAPFRAEQVAAAGLAHAFCGHYHTPADAPLYTYPGNPEPLSFGESEEAQRGVVLATIAGDGSVDRERHQVAQTEVADVAVDVTRCATGGEVCELVAAELGNRQGYARVTLHGELAPEVDLLLSDVARAADWMKAVIPRTGALSVGYDIEAIRGEATVRGQFVEDVLTAGLPEEPGRKIVVTGLRALEGRSDLEVV